MKHCLTAISVTGLILFAPLGHSKSCDHEYWVPAGKYDKRSAEGCKLACSTKEKYSDFDIVEQPGAKVGDFIKCPVSGVVFKAKKESTKVSYGGSDFYVCCSSCAAKFSREPTKYLKLTCNIKKENAVQLSSAQNH